MIDDGVDGDGCLARLPVADDQFALASADRNHAIDCLDAGLHRLLHGLPFDDARSQAFDGVELIGEDRPFSIDRLAESVDHTANQRFANRNRHDAARALDFVAFPEVLVFAEQHRAHLVFFQVHGNAGNAVGKLDEFAGHDAFQAVDAGDAIAQRDDGAGFGNVDRVVVILNLLAENACDFVCSDLSHILFLSTTLNGKFLCQLTEAAADGTIVYRSAHTGDYAADQ